MNYKERIIKNAGIDPAIMYGTLGGAAIGAIPGFFSKKDKLKKILLGSLAGAGLGAGAGALGGHGYKKIRKLKSENKYLSDVLNRSYADERSFHDDLANLFAKHDEYYDRYNPEGSIGDILKDRDRLYLEEELAQGVLDNHKAEYEAHRKNLLDAIYHNEFMSDLEAYKKLDDLKWTIKALNKQKPDKKYEL